MEEKANIGPEKEKSEWTKTWYTNFNIGILSMLFGLLTPFVLPILGSVLAPFVFLGGAIAVILAKQPIWVRLVTILVFVVPVVIWWDWYVSILFEWNSSINQPAD